MSVISEADVPCHSAHENDEAVQEETLASVDEQLIACASDEGLSVQESTSTFWGTLNASAALRQFLMSDDDDDDDGAGSTSATRKRKRITELDERVTEFMRSNIFNPSLNCHGSKDITCREPQRGDGKLCNAHAREKFISSQFRFNFPSVSAFQKYATRIGKYRVLSLDEEASMELKNTLGQEGVRARVMWRDNHINRCGDEFFARTLEHLQEILKATRATDSYISFPSVGCLEIDILDMLMQCLSDEMKWHDSGLRVKVFHLYCICLARGGDASKSILKRGGGDIRLVKCRFVLFLSTEAVNKYVAEKGMRAMLPLPSADSISDHIICFRAALRGCWQLQEMATLKVSDYVPTLRPVVPNIMALMERKKEDGQIMHDGVRAQLQKECSSVWDSLTSKQDWIVPQHTTAVHRSEMVCSFLPRQYPSSTTANGT